jgi:hypothetical protein
MSALLLRNDSSLTVTVAPEAKELRTKAMMLAVEIESVTDAASQEKAVEAQTALANVAKLIEDARRITKAPVLDYGRAIDKAASDFLANVINEQTRVSRMIGDYQAIERAKMQAAEAAQKAELTRLERERSAELAKANTFEQREQVHERYAQEVDAACQAAKVAAPPRVEGQIIKEEWEFEVTDAYALATNHRHLVKIEPKRSDIKEALKSGACQPCNGDGFRTMEGAKVTCPDCKGSGFYRPVMGVKAWKTTKASVRATKPKELAVQVL